MAEESSKSIDLLGAKPAAEATKIATEAAVGILEKLLGPGAKEFGLYLRDVVAGWRKKNVVAMTKKVEKKMLGNNTGHVHPRILHSVIDQSSLAEDSVVQDLWAGLLVSSCTDKGDDDSNIIFINMLRDLTRLQARVLKFVCENAQKMASGSLIQANWVHIPFDEFCKIAEETDIQRIDRELDHLNVIGLSRGGLPTHGPQNVVAIEPTPLALHMYVRCSGSRADPVEFFKLRQSTAPPPLSPATQP